MAGFSIEKSKQKITDLKKEVGEKQGKLENLETSKKELLSAITELLGANISEEAKEKSREALTSELGKVSDQGQALSDEIGEKTKEYETEVQEIQEVSESNEEKQKSLENKKSILSRLNMGELKMCIRDRDLLHSFQRREPWTEKTGALYHPSHTGKMCIRDRCLTDSVAEIEIYLYVCEIPDRKGTI